MNTLGVEYMNWEVLYEVDRLGLQLPPGWDCTGREFEEQRMEANYSTQYLGGAPTEDINFRRPVSSSYSFRSERHGGTFATPAAALSMINSNPNPPPAIPAAQKAALPETQTAFVWGRQGQESHPAPVIVPPTTMSQRQISPADTYRFGA
ncbi:hypothetical protein EV426DRAFT_583054 [Tirmania nivea]|nr:hypothetical protein EV426DRAFT_583054 [Tirmania nivea]